MPALVGVDLFTKILKRNSNVTCPGTGALKAQ